MKILKSTWEERAEEDGEEIDRESGRGPRKERGRVKEDGKEEREMR